MTERETTAEFIAKTSSTEPDWSREQRSRGVWDPGRALIGAIRRHQGWAGRAGVVAALARRRWALAHRFWSIVTGADIPLSVRFGGGLLLPHPNGIVIHPEVEIGPNCLLFQQVTIGAANGGGVPRLGGHVDVGAGAKLLGGIVVGDHVRIGANAVVLEDMPDRSVAAAVPTRYFLPGVEG